MFQELFKSGNNPQNLSSECLMLLTKEITECFLQTDVQLAYNSKSFLSKNSSFFIRKNKNSSDLMAEGLIL